MCSKRVPRVRIPISPPDYSRAPEARFIRGFAPIIRGRVAERLNAAVSKTVLPLIEVTRVQIPPLPPVDAGSLRGAFLILGGMVFCTHGRYIMPLNR